MTSRHLIVVSVLLLAGAGCASTDTKVTYEVHPMLMAVDAKNHEEPIYVGIGAGGQKPDAIVVSPDKKHVVSALWENEHYAINLSDLPNQTFSREIATQVVPEGHGGIEPSSLQWVDDRTILYRENGTPCGEDGQPTTLNPTKECDGTIVLIYRVDIETGTKTMTDRWMQTVKPLKP